MGKALDFIEEFDQNDNLFIVYYAGHGTMNENRQSVWTCRRDLQYASVDWSSIQSLFTNASSDVLILLDCCAAASAATTSGNGVVETIAACGFEGKAPPPGRFSFTNTLIEVLEDWKSRPSFSVASLHSEILFQLKAKRPEKGRNGGPRMEWCRTPVHFIYSSDPKAVSIELGRREPGEIKDHTAVERASPPYSRRLTTEIDSPVPGVPALGSTESPGNALTSTTPSGNLTVPHVLISVALEESQENLDLESWRRWLTGFPALVKYARIQGVYKSYSTLLTLSLPVMIWDMLPKNPACCFIGYVTSQNMWAETPKRLSLGEDWIPMGNQDSFEMQPFQELKGATATFETSVNDSHDQSRPPSIPPPRDLFCKTCQNHVERPSDLKTHELQHQIPLVCQVSGCLRAEGFSTSNDLENHIKTKHQSYIPPPDEVYRCLVPGCKSKTKSWLLLDHFRDHLKRIHGNQLRSEEEFNQMVKRFVIVPTARPNSLLKHSKHVIGEYIVRHPIS